MYYANGFIEYKGYSIEIEWNAESGDYSGVVHGLLDGYFVCTNYNKLIEGVKQKIDGHERNR